MTDTLQDVVLTRPEPAPNPGPLDDRFYDLVEARFRRILADNPLVGTYLGIHTEDHRLGDGTRDAVLAELAADKEHLAAIEALDEAGLSADARFERDLEIHNVRRQNFDTEVVRTWERRSTALDVVGDALFLLFAQDFAPLPERLDSIASRLEAVPAWLEQSRDRAVVPQVQSWQELEIESAADLPSFFDEIVTAGADLPDAERRRLMAAADTARAAIADYGAWLKETLAKGTDAWALGRERYDELVGLRAFDGLDADAILEIGEDQLETNKAARIRAAAESRRPRHRGRGHRPPQGRPPGDVRGGPRRLPRRHGPSAPAPDRPRHRDRPGGRADRRRRDARVPPQRHPVRGVLLAAQVRPEAEGHLHRHARRSATTRTRCSSTTSARSATRASTRHIPAITSSSTSRTATRR